MQPEKPRNLRNLWNQETCETYDTQKPMKPVKPRNLWNLWNPETYETNEQGPRRVFWSGGGGLNRSRKGESSSGMPGARSPGKIEMAGNGSSKQLYIDKRHIKDPKELKVTWGIIIQSIHGYTEKLTTYHTTKCIRATAGTISFCFPHMTVTKM